MIMMVLSTQQTNLLMSLV